MSPDAEYEQRRDAAERTLSLLRERGLDALRDPEARQSLSESFARIEALLSLLRASANAFSEGRSTYDPELPS